MSRRGLGIVLVVVAFCLLLLTAHGCGGEAQFSPVTFERRGVRTYAIPYTNVRLFTFPSDPYRPRIVQFWIEEGYLKPESGPTERWDVVTGYTGNWMRRSGSAKVFWYHAGCNSDEAAEEWIEWSRRHPELAADLWPRVVGLLQQAVDLSRRAESYGSAGVLMTCVQQAEDAKIYHERIAEWQEWVAEFKDER